MKSENFSTASSIAGIVEEYLDALRRGDRPSVDAYVARAPDRADELRRVLPILALLEEAKSASAENAAPASGGNGRRSLASGQARLGDYRILREIGRGGMGVVYEAEQESLGRRVALKVLVPHVLLDAKHIKRFHREARAAAQLHHTNIVPVFGVGEFEGTHYIVMQHIDGQGLDRVIDQLRRHADGRLERRKSPDRVPIAPPEALDTIHDGSTEAIRLSQSTSVVSSLSSSGGRHWQNIARIGLEMARALAYAHAHGTLHRDLKPSNLLVDTSGTAWITDFGLAKAMDEEDLTATGDILGTLRYLPPEALRGQCDARGDIFALGLTLFELCALRPARDAVQRDELIRQVSDHAPPCLRRLVPDIPRDLETIIHKSIEADPRRRYQETTQLVADLEHFASDRPILARPIGYVERIWRWCRRNPLVAATTLAASVAVAASLSVAFASMLTAKNDAVAAAATETALRREADNRTVEARENLRFARKTVSRYLTVMGESDELKARGLEPFRRKLLENAREFYDQLNDQRGDDPDLQADRATGYVKLGRFMQDTGYFQEGLDLVDRAQPVLESLQRQFPANESYADQLADCYAIRGRILPKLSRFDEADDMQERALALYKKLADARPDDRRRLLTLAGAYQLLGVSYYNRDAGDTRGREYFDKSLALYRQLTAAAPNQPDWRRMMAEVMTNVGQAQRREGRYSESEAIFKEAIEVLEPIRRDHPEIYRTLSNLALVHGAYGVLCEDMKRPDEAVTHYQTAVDLFAELIERRPELAMYREFQAMNLRKLGNLHSAAGRWSDAIEAFTRACDNWEKQLRRNATVQVQALLGATLRELSLVHLRLDQNVHAAQALERSVKLLAAVREKRPRSLLSRLDPALSYFHMARALRRLGRFDAMTEALAQAESEIDQALKPQSEPANLVVVRRAAQLRNEVHKLRRRPPEPAD
jgi:serine/threonine protein kinase